tara:strand:+ start:16060 stop:16437 length:378 start_codon:yes stop_codon:yes gene_type:complete
LTLPGDANANLFALRACGDAPPFASPPGDPKLEFNGRPGDIASAACEPTGLAPGVETPGEPDVPRGPSEGGVPAAIAGPGARGMLGALREVVSDILLLSSKAQTVIPRVLVDLGKMGVENSMITK